ncbi:MAG: glycogen-binding domain-containing protein [Longimicrobiales bacterium]
MTSDLHKHLDGELAPEALDAGTRDEAEQWDRMVESFRTAAPRAQAPAWLEQRVMAEIEAAPEPSPIRRALDWLVSPAPIRVPPLAAGLAFAALAIVFLRTGGEDDLAAGAAVQEVVYVQFLLEAPSATSVAVAGDFSSWEPSFAMADPDGDGVWSARVPVRPGVHAYMFLVDETSWLTDPNAGRYQDDGFGNRNAVLAVGAES